MVKVFFPVPVRSMTGAVGFPLFTEKVTVELAVVGIFAKVSVVLAMPLLLIVSMRRVVGPLAYPFAIM